MSWNYFMELSRIAFRSLARHRVKTFLTVFAVTLSVSMYIVMDGWIIGLQTASRRSIVNYETGAAKLQSQAYVEKVDDLPMYENFDGWETYAAVLDKAGYDVAPRFVFTGTMLCAEGSAPIWCCGDSNFSNICLFPHTQSIENVDYR